MSTSASAQERLQLAREIHDGIAQDLVGLGYEIDLLLARAHEENSARSEIRALRFRVDNLIGKVRKDMYSLRDPTQRSLQEELKEIASRLCGELLLRADIGEFAVQTNVAPAIKSIATELLRNAVQHSRASEIELQLKHVENHTYLEVRDNGIGGATVESTRLGLIGIREHVNSLGGVFHLHSHSKGTLVAITL